MLVFPPQNRLRPKDQIRIAESRENMYLVQVDDGLPEVVLLLVEVSHTNLTEVTGMVLLTDMLATRRSSRPFFRYRKSLEPCPCWYGGGADHQRDHDHLDACGACRHDRDRQRRGRDCKTRIVSIHDSIFRGRSIPRPCVLKENFGIQTTPTIDPMDDCRKPPILSSIAIPFSSGGYNHVQLAGLRSSGRHGDGCGVVAFPMFCRRRLEVGGDDFAPTGVCWLYGARKIVSERADQP